MDTTVKNGNIPSAHDMRKVSQNKVLDKNKDIINLIISKIKESAEKGETICNIPGEALGITKLNEVIVQTLTELGYRVDEVANTYYTDYNSYSLKISW